MRLILLFVALLAVSHCIHFAIETYFDHYPSISTLSITDHYFGENLILYTLLLWHYLLIAMHALYTQINTMDDYLMEKGLETCK